MVGGRQSFSSRNFRQVFPPFGIPGEGPITFENCWPENLATFMAQSLQILPRGEKEKEKSKISPSINGENWATNDLRLEIYSTPTENEGESISVSLQNWHTGFGSLSPILSLDSANL